MQHSFEKFVFEIWINSYCLEYFLFEGKLDEYLNFPNNKELLAKLKNKSNWELESDLLASLFIIAIFIYALIVPIFSQF